MRRPCTAVLLAALVWGCGRDETPMAAPVAGAAAPAAATQRPAADPNGVARLEWDRTEHDFGLISDARTHNTSFNFTNTGTGKLVISKVKASCGCTTPMLDGSEYMPGESGTIRVSFNPSKKHGTQNKPIAVTTNAEPEPIVKLVVRAEIRPLFKPARFIQQFGTLKLGREYRRTVDFSYWDPGLEITGIDVANPHITGRVVEMGNARGDGSYGGVLEVIVEEDVEWGYLEDTSMQIRVRGRDVTGETIEKDYMVVIAGQFYGDLRPEPAVLRASGVVARGRPYEMTAMIFRTSGEPFSISGAGAEDLPGAEVRVEPVSDSSYRVVLAGTTPAAGRALRGEVWIETDVPGEERLRLPVSATIR